MEKTHKTRFATCPIPPACFSHYRGSEEFASLHTGLPVVQTKSGKTRRVKVESTKLCAKVSHVCHTGTNPFGQGGSHTFSNYREIRHLRTRHLRTSSCQDFQRINRLRSASIKTLRGEMMPGGKTDGASSGLVGGVGGA